MYSITLQSQAIITGKAWLIQCTSHFVAQSILVYCLKIREAVITNFETFDMTRHNFFRALVGVALGLLKQ